MSPWGIVEERYDDEDDTLDAGGWLPFVNVYVLQFLEVVPRCEVPGASTQCGLLMISPSALTHREPAFIVNITRPS
jgi:hypothetical protein